MNGQWKKLEHRLIDTHCHILDYNDDQLLEDLDKKQLKVHAVTTTLAEFRTLQPLVESYQNIFPSLGLFPLKVRDELQNLDEFLSLIPQTKFIGEIGLDYTAPEDDQKLQRGTLQKIIQTCNETPGKVLSLHSRGSAEDVLKTIGKSFQGSAIMHWYSGPLDLINKAPKNIFFSVNTAMLKSRNGKQILKTLQPSQVLTETDGPYVLINNQPAYPSDIKNIIQALSIRWKKTTEETLNIISENHHRAVNSYGV